MILLLYISLNCTSQQKGEWIRLRILLTMRPSSGTWEFDIFIFTSISKYIYIKDTNNSYKMVFGTKLFDI